MPEPVQTRDPAACERALILLGNLQSHQARLARSPALAWERAAFAEAFNHPEPGLRIRRFLGGEDVTP